LAVLQEEEESRKRSSLAGRRERLAAQLAAEEKAYRTELNRLPRDERRSIIDMRQLREEFRYRAPFK
jgi:hypothetical protein